MSDSNDTDPTPDPDKDQNFANLRAQHEAAQRENVFLRAGVDVDTVQGKLLMKGYEGALDVDAIKAYRTEVFGEPAPTNTGGNGDEPPAAEPAPNPDPYAQDIAGQSAVRDALAGAGGAGTIIDENPEKGTYDDVYENYHQDRKNGVPLERAQLAAVDRVIVAGAEGKADVTFDPAAWEQKKAEAGHRPKQMQDR